MIAIIDYDAGNTRSVINALKSLNTAYVLSADPKILSKAEKVILPGVGHARPAMEKLKNNGLDIFLKNCTVPVLGICLGMQLLCDQSEEGNTTCLGLINQKVRLFDTAVSGKVPHMGWNNVIPEQNNGLLDGIDSISFFYFVHSYFVPESVNTLASCDYGLRFSAVIQKNNFYGVQFHPEKSGKIGLHLLSNFLNL